jgi:hypothetical protein
MANSYAVIERIRLERAFDAVMLPSPLGGAWLPAPSMTMNCDESEPFIYVLKSFATLQSGHWLFLLITER